ncbi:hybrid sensor histidine kinase/response regulator [Aliterella atlantica]|uniref:hybrid sensor histidine kinase/response regulator n=1 Tax=Aliterella atlantica TaxID=1827278 RepID=UPI000696ADCF|nr:response regulator [Aliterella atlantica]
MSRPVQTLLLIESFLPDRELYKCYLLSDSTYNYQLLEADSVLTGLELCRTQKIDAILIDYLLPDADGLQFLELLHAQSNIERPPVVMVTGQGNEAIAVRAIKLGAEDYLVKQRLTPEILQFTMRSAIENARLRLQLRQSDDRFRVSLENMLDSFGIYSAMRDESGQIVDFRFDYLNAAALESNQMTQADLGKTLCQVLPAHRETGLFQEYCRVVETGEPLIKEDLIYSDVFGTERLTRAYDLRVAKLGDGIVASWRDVTARKQAEIALHQANKRIVKIWESMTDAYIMLDREWRIVYANPVATQVIRQLTHQEAAEFLGKTHWEVFPWSVGQIVEQNYRRAMAQQVAIHFELLYEPSEDWFEIHAYPASEGLGIYFRDISDRKRDEQRLRESQEQLQLGIQVAGVALARFDYASNTVALSPEAAALYGISSDATIVTRDRLHATFHPDERTMLAQIIEQVIDPAGSGWFTLDHRVVWQNGEVRWLSVQKKVFFDSSNSPRPDYAILAAIDITDRKHYEATIQQQLAQIEAIYTSAPIGLCFLDRELRFVQLNERLAQINGLSVSEHLGRTVQEVLPELAAVQAQIFEQVLQTGIPVLDVEVQGTTPAQPDIERYWLVNYYPLIAVDAQILGINIMVQEITERKRDEIERNRLLAAAEAARAEAEEANRSKDDFVAVIAHELRSPLNSIAGWAKLLQTRKFDEATQAKALDTIWRNTQTQVQLIEDLLDISRMVRGSLHLTLAPVNLATVIESAIDIVLPQAQAKHIELNSQIVGQPLVSGDLNRLQQIVVNLLTNAIKFTPQQGRVEIELKQVDEQVQLRVSDTGKGIAPEFLPQIFERFSQGQKNTNSKDGLGLGLAIVKHLVELHQGTIAPESAGIGQGATFTVRLPLLSAPAMPQKPNLPGKLDKIRVLAVDDEPDMLDLITFVLQEAGAEVQAVTTIAAALESLSQFKPDILISDIAMPDGNGYELVQQMKSQLEGNIPAIALTAYASATYEERSRQAGFDRHLSKPVEPEVLVSAIINLLHEKSNSSC